MEKKFDGTHYLLMYLIGYSFFTSQIYNQLLYSYYGLSLTIPFLIAFLILPLFVFYICKKINNHSKLKPKGHFVYTLISFIYFFVVNVITINYVSVLLQNYYYETLPSYILSFILILPTMYICFKNSKTYYSLSFIMLFIYMIYMFIYLINHQTTDIYPFSNILNINEPWQVILLSILVILEPITLLTNISNIDEHKKINIKFIVIITLILSAFNIYTLFRETMEFGLLIELIKFPNFESFRLITLQGIFEVIDYIYLFSIIIFVFVRLPIFIFILKDEIKIKFKGVAIILFIFIVATFYLDKRLEFYRTIIIPSIMICCLLLIILLILSFFTRRKTNPMELNNKLYKKEKNHEKNKINDNN